MKLYLTLFALCSFLYGFTQTFPENASLPQETNEVGDPLNNGVDPNGAKQGAWFYVNTAGETTARQMFQDNELLSTEIRTSETSEWVSLYSMSSNQEQLTTVKNLILQTLGSTNLGASQAIVVYKSLEGEWAVHLFGTWTNPEAKADELLQILENQLIQNNFYAIIQ
jgi:hypothetical protein